MQHDLKIWPEYFEPVRRGLKTFDFRHKDERDFRVGDFILLREWDNYERRYTGRSIKVRITYIMDVKDALIDLDENALPWCDYIIINFVVVQ